MLGGAPPPLQPWAVGGTAGASAPRMGAGCQRSAGPITAAGSGSTGSSQPVLLLDVMDTIGALAVLTCGIRSICSNAVPRRAFPLSLKPSPLSLKPPPPHTHAVYDPFFHDMPRFFGCTFKELLAAKHPTAWLQVRRPGARCACVAHPVRLQVHRRLAAGHTCCC